jgi:hypothetical protein
MDSIKELLTCKLCKKYLIGTPIALSCCDATICGFHFDDQLNKNKKIKGKRKMFKCDLCNSSHDMKNKRFPSNKLAEELILRKFEEFKYGKVHEEAKQACNNMKSSLEETKKMINDPTLSINQVVNGLKYKVNSKRRILKLEIDKKSDEMIKRLEIYLEECYQNIYLDEIQEKIKTVEDEFRTNHEMLDTWAKELNLLLNDEAKWESIKEKADLSNSKIKWNLNELNMNLLKDKFWNFESNSNELKTFERFYFNLNAHKNFFAIQFY